MNSLDRTLIIVKPDGVQRGLVGEVLRRLEQRGLRIAALKLMQVDDETARRHYAEHEAKPFFPELVGFITSGPVVIAVLEGIQAPAVVRRTMGSTNPADSAPGTIRGDLALSLSKNVIHGSDSPESAEREIGVFFKPEEILSYTRSIDDWII